MSLQRSDGLASVSWSEGPLALWRVGMSVINVWQRVWLDNLSRTQGLFNVWPATSEKTLAPWSDLLGRWNKPLAASAATVTKARAGEPGKGAAQAVLPLAAPPSERQQVEAAIAAKQGGVTAKLGCLEGVEVVGGPESAGQAAAPVAEAAAAVAPSPAAADSVTSMLAMQAKSLAKAARQAAKADPKPVRKAAKPAAPVKVGKTAVVAAKAANKPVKPSAKGR